MKVQLETDELGLHERVLQHDPVAPSEVFRVFMDPILNILVRDLACDRWDAHDAAVEAVLAYLEQPDRYDPKKGRLLTYLAGAAKHRLVDHLRSAAAQARREQKFAELVELQARPPNERLEETVEARLAWERFEKRMKSEEDRQAFRLILQGKQPAERFAEVFGLTSLPRDAMEREVKRNRDRLMKLLERFRREGPDGNP